MTPQDTFITDAQRRANENPQWQMPPNDAAYGAAKEEAERVEFDQDNDGERWDGLS